MWAPSLAIRVSAAAIIGTSKRAGGRTRHAGRIVAGHKGNSRECSAKNPNKPFKVVQAAGGKRKNLGCYDRNGAMKR